MSDLIPIDDIEAKNNDLEFKQDVVPETLSDDPFIGDGSAGRKGYNVASWRLHTLNKKTLVGVTEYEGNDRASRNARRAQQASREARQADERALRRKRRVKVGAILVFIVSCIAVLGATYAMELWGGKEIPDVAGYTEGNAVGLLEEKGFSVQVDYAASDSLEGHVVEEKPKAGERVEEGSTVTIVVGEKREIPDVIGKTEEEAKKELEKAGATNVRVETVVVLDEEEGLVHETRPAAGSVFISTEEVVLVVTQLPRVPTVVGNDEQTARKAMDDSGIPSKVTYERSTPENRLKVIRTEPGEGERIDPGQEVTVVVGESLIGALRVEDYFDEPLSKCRSFLEGEGYALKAAKKEGDNSILVRFEGSNGIKIAFLDQPWTHSADSITENDNVITDGTKVTGVRLMADLTREKAATDAEDAKGTSKGMKALGLDSAPVDESTAKTVAQACGLGEIAASCTQQTIKLPEGVENKGHNFYCCYGETDKHVWTVLVAGADEKATEAERVVVTCTPKSFFETANMAESHNAICDYVAYIDEYTK